jgi:hypothetical protein
MNGGKPVVQRATSVDPHRQGRDNDQGSGDNDGDERSIAHVQNLQDVFHLNVEATRPLVASASRRRHKSLLAGR